MNDVDGAGRPVADERSAGELVKLMAEQVSVWKLAAREDDAPEATAAQRNWREIMAAAALQGAAEGTRKLTGIWPGEGGQQPGKEA